MKNSNKNKAEQLKMPAGTANARLKKMILFHLVKELNRDYCFQCKKIIKHIDEFSIEHKIPWLNSNDPIGLFFDINNIAFSHLKCNIATTRRDAYFKSKMKKCPEGMAWCNKCKDFYSIKNFYKNSSRLSGLQNICIDCVKSYRTK